MMAQAWNRMRGNRAPEYAPLPLSEKEPTRRRREHVAKERAWRVLQVLGALVCIYGLASIFSHRARAPALCDTIEEGYRCNPETTHFWGQYSPWFAVPSEIDVAAPDGCDVTFASVLSRHGGRDPTLGKSMAYHIMIADIQNATITYPGEFAFLKDYEYALGADQLTDAGRQEMVNSGAHFYRRYAKLFGEHTPFVRSGGQQRVVESAERWLTGVAQSRKEEPRKIDLIIPEGTDWNNTLSHDTCPAFEDGPDHDLGDRAQQVWAAKFVPPIQERVNSALGTNLSVTYILYLMDMCPFETLAHPVAKISDFCQLFTEKEWREYDYFQSLGKFYGYSVGNPLGPTQGVGYVNELLARLTEQPVQDNTNTNHTLDSNPATFPLDRKVYADFSHDNDISNVLAALGLYNETHALYNTTIEDTKETHGYSAAWTVPFASRLYVEKLQCRDDKEESVRIIVNDRVHPLEFCGGDEYGRCTLSEFVESQSFARSGGHWSRCYD
ncbi:acid phosphatase [Decorospora gaudefroyi]|uniref:Phytase A n=1 Tax=Decorospora gaudefroyi TaxID=184978 RepID=A0A6A5KGR7_9PLEO|nr:acid phosphatase [Decorospora gaudefroyi]